jgi:hypothetical protein
MFAIACNNKADKPVSERDTVTNEKESVVTKAVDRNLVGKWHPVVVDVPSMSETEKKDLIDNAVIEMTADGKITTTMKDTKRTGTYMYSEQDAKLHTKLGDKEEKFDISWDNDLLKMKNSDGTVTLKKE